MSRHEAPDHSLPDPGPALEAIFRPRAVAVVGASADPKKRGHQALRALLDDGFAGAVHPVNPRGGEILGLEVVPSVDALPDGVQLALVCLPGSAVPATLESCAARGIGAAVVLATGFGEAGEAGAALEDRVRRVVRRSGIRVVGPNTSGILRPSSGLNLVGAREVRAGGLALLLQSGNVALGLLTEAARRPGAGISAYVGVGNETDLGFHDYLGWLAADSETRAVLVYADGFRRPRAFLRVAARTAREKPVVVLTSGRTASGARAALTHTGAVSSPWALLRAGLRQAGVTIVERADELLAVGSALAGQPPVASPAGVAILSDGGGHAALAADALTEMGVELTRLHRRTLETLRELLGPTAALANPVDVGGPADSDPGVFPRTLEALAADPGVGGVLLVGLFGGYHDRFAPELEAKEMEAAKTMASAMRRAGKPLVTHTLFAETELAPLTLLGEAGVPLVGSLEVGCRAIATLVERGRMLARPAWDPALPGSSEASEPSVSARTRSEDPRVLTEPEARALVAGFDVEVVPAFLCRSEAETAELARLFGERAAAGGSPEACDKAGGETAEPPLVLKLVSPLAPHKSEVGGVELGVRGPEAARAAFHRIRERARIHFENAGADPESAFQGVLVSPLLPPPVAELLIGARREPRLGPLLTVGAGGTTVELLGDVAHRVLPVEADEVIAMLTELRMAASLSGHPGRAAADLDALAGVALGIASCLLARPDLLALEANPVFAYSDRAVAVDLRAVLGARNDAG